MFDVVVYYGRALTQSCMVFCFHACMWFCSRNSFGPPELPYKRYNLQYWIFFLPRLIIGLKYVLFLLDYSANMPG